MSTDLSVVGVPLRVGVKYAPRLSMRRIYNKKYFRDERYRHEVANHYRDFKMQQTTLQTLNRQLSLTRRKQRVRCVRLRPLVAPEVASLTAASSYGQFQFRSQLPTHVHYFPRFGDTYTPRGRQTICSRAPPDDTYNDTLRRIKSAQSCEQLKELVKRHLD